VDKNLFPQKGPYPTGLLRRETYLCAIASGDGLRPLRAQSTIPILESIPNPYDPKSAKCTTSIKVVTTDLQHIKGTQKDFSKEAQLASNALRRQPQSQVPP